MKEKTLELCLKIIPKYTKIQRGCWAHPFLPQRGGCARKPV